MRFTYLAIVLTFFAFSSAVSAQPRMVDRGDGRVVPAAPPSVKAKYEGGMFGYSDKESGTLRFDDTNERVAFFGEDGKEKFGIPYAAILLIYPDEKSVASTAGTVVSHIPLPGAGLASLIREKRRYMVIQYDDPDVDVKGLTSFKFENKDILESVIYSLGAKAKLRQRGDAFIKPKSGS